MYTEQVLVTSTLEYNSQTTTRTTNMAAKDYSTWDGRKSCFETDYSRITVQPAEESLTTPSTLSEKVDNSDTVEFGPAGTKSL